uniref:Uncharacterized protein n=1 Tax=viral metagenome TaxID=1070528 RepID=A0A6C0EG03_9ZZZZ
MTNMREMVFFKVGFNLSCATLISVCLLFSVFRDINNFSFKKDSRSSSSIYTLGSSSPDSCSPLS